MNFFILIAVRAIFICTIVLGHTIHGNCSYMVDFSPPGYRTQPDSNLVRNQDSISIDSSLTMQAVFDRRTGQISCYVPLPKTWIIYADTWRGPNNTKVILYEGQMSPLEQGPYQSSDQLIQAFFEPILKREKMSIEKIYELPEIAKRNQTMTDDSRVFGNAQTQYQAKAIEIKNVVGEKGLIIISFMIIRNTGFGDYSYFSYCVLEASGDDFDTSKNTLIYALANVQVKKQKKPADGIYRRGCSGSGVCNHQWLVKDPKTNKLVNPCRRQIWDIYESNPVDTLSQEYYNSYSGWRTESLYNPSDSLDLNDQNWKKVRSTDSNYN